jgi:hypothetical protein
MDPYEVKVTVETASEGPGLFTIAAEVDETQSSVTVSPDATVTVGGRFASKNPQ